MVASDVWKGHPCTSNVRKFKSPLVRPLLLKGHAFKVHEGEESLSRELHAGLKGPNSALGHKVGSLMVQQRGPGLFLRQRVSPPEEETHGFPQARPPEGVPLSLRCFSPVDWGGVRSFLQSTPFDRRRLDPGGGGQKMGSAEFTQQSVMTSDVGFFPPRKTPTHTACARPKGSQLYRSHSNPSEDPCRGKRSLPPLFLKPQ